jgi:hypothetical protein
MAVAIYVTGISTPELHLESPPLLVTLTRPLARVLADDWKRLMRLNATPAEINVTHGRTQIADPIAQPTVK